MKSPKSFIMIIFIIFLTGCVNKEEQIAELKVEVNSFLENGEFDKAIKLYEEMLTIKEDEALNV